MKVTSKGIEIHLEQEEISDFLNIILFAKEYRKLNSVNAMKEKLERNYILGDHEGKDIDIEILEKEFY